MNFTIGGVFLFSKLNSCNFIKIQKDKELSLPAIQLLFPVPSSIKLAGHTHVSLPVGFSSLLPGQLQTPFIGILSPMHSNDWYEWKM